MGQGSCICYEREGGHLSLLSCKGRYNRWVGIMYMLRERGGVTYRYCHVREDIIGGQGSCICYEREGGHLSLLSCKGRYCRFSLAEIAASPSLMDRTRATDLQRESRPPGSISSSSSSPETQLHTRLIKAIKAVWKGCGGGVNGGRGVEGVLGVCGG